VTKLRQSPPTIRIHGRNVRMSGNSKDGYRLQVDDLFTCAITCRKSPSYWTFWSITCGAGNPPVACRWIEGIHEQKAANAVAAWFEKRANGWGYR
jgi:hypothetical protein